MRDPLELVARVVRVLTELQHASCDYSQRHPKGPCDCKFDAPLVYTYGMGDGQPAPPFRPSGVGALHRWEGSLPVSAAAPMVDLAERTGCPELRGAIFFTEHYAQMVKFLEERRILHVSWRTCACEQCTGFRQAAGFA